VQKEGRDLHFNMLEKEGPLSLANSEKKKRTIHVKAWRGEKKGDFVKTDTPLFKELKEERNLDKGVGIKAK